jgi:hypothetical protein
MSDRDENLRDYLVLLRRFGLSTGELARLHWSGASDPPDVPAERIVASEIDVEARTHEALYSRLHRLLAASSVGIELPSSASPSEFEAALQAAFDHHDAIIELEPIADPDLATVGEGDPIDVLVTDRHGTTRSTTDTFPGPEELPELAGVIERELLADVEVTFVLLEPTEDVVRMLLLSEPRLEALRETYGDRVAFGGRDLLAERQPIDFVSASARGADGVTAADAGTHSGAREDGSPRADEARPTDAGDGVLEDETASGDAEANWLSDDDVDLAHSVEDEGNWLEDDDDVDLEDVGFEPATVESTEDESAGDENDDIDTFDIDRAFAEMESTASEPGREASPDTNAADSTESVGGSEAPTGSIEAAVEAGARDPPFAEGPEEDASGPSIQPGADPEPAVSSIRVTPVDDPDPTITELGPSVVPSASPRPATTNLAVVPREDPTPAIERIEDEPTISPTETPRPAVRALTVTPGTDPTPALERLTDPAAVEPASEQATDRIDVLPGDDPEPAVSSIATTPGDDTESAVGVIDVVPGTDVEPAVRPQPDSLPAVTPDEEALPAASPAEDTRPISSPADDPQPAASRLETRPAAAPTPATSRIAVTPAADPDPAVSERTMGPQVRPGDDPQPAVHRAVSSPADTASTVEGGADSETAATEPEGPTHETEPMVSPGESPTSAVHRIAVTPGEEPEEAVFPAPFVNSRKSPSDPDTESEKPTSPDDSKGIIERVTGWFGDRL